jgi:hypothetical protein
MRVTKYGVPVDTLITVVKNSLKRAGVSRSSDTPDLQVASVQLILEAVASSAVGGKLDLRIPFVGMRFGANAKVTKRDTHTIDITLTPPDEPERREVRGMEIEEALVDAITTIRAVVTCAAAGDDPWLLTSGKVDLSFVVTDTGSISFGFDGEHTDEITHTLRIDFASHSRA